jgi:hypothetical protein
MGIAARVGGVSRGTTISQFAEDGTIISSNGTTAASFTLRAGVGFRKWDFFGMYDVATLTYGRILLDGEETPGTDHRLMVGIGYHIFPPRNVLNILIQVAGGVDILPSRHLRTSQSFGTEWSEFEAVPLIHSGVNFKIGFGGINVLAGPYVTVAFDQLMSDWLSNRETFVEVGAIIGMDFHSRGFRLSKPQNANGRSF